MSLACAKALSDFPAEGTLCRYICGIMSIAMETATARKLRQYFEDWLGTPASSEQDFVRLVEAGLSLKILEHLLQKGLSRQEISVIIHPRTLKHRRSRREPLSREESERAVRTARILARAQAVMGERDAALRWMRTPKRRFKGKSPLEMLSTEPGGRLVEEMLIQIDEGIFA
jgi:putative toxin-antitoxin system antitoxin component (TIGR02293 family)